MTRELLRPAAGLTRVRNRFPFCVAALIALGYSAAFADITWNGTIGGSKVKFALTDSATGASRWVRVGDTFASYSISQFDEQKQQLVLSKDGSVLTLEMAASQYTAPAPTPLPGVDLHGLSGMRLAQVLADRGDIQLKSLLAQLRDAQLNRQAVSRNLEMGERALRAGSPNAPSPVALKSLRADLIHWDQELNRIGVEIRTTADAKRP